MKTVFMLASLLAGAVLSVIDAHAECEPGQTVTSPIAFVGREREPVIMGLRVMERTTNYPGTHILSVLTDKVAAGAVSRHGEFVVIDQKSDAYDGNVG